ncbi:MAG: AAA family ATPase [Planctomycetales bacterium]|nr:AAA family ATPase [Planctomycetales bacterium]
MYEQFWGLDRKPFDNRFSQEMYFAADQFRAAELKLRYVIESRLPAVLLTGGAGVGKSTVLRLLEERLRGEVLFHPIMFPQLSSEQLLALIAARLAGKPVQARHAAADSLRQIEDTLMEGAANDAQHCLVIDECHAMPAESFETLRLLSNLSETPGMDLTLLLSGQPQIRKTLQAMPQFEDRLSARVNLSRLSPRDTSEYVRHRLAAAGAQRPIFSESAIEQLHNATMGVPGRINRLADMTLLIGYADDVSLISAEHVRNVDRGLFTMPWAA